MRPASFVLLGLLAVTAGAGAQAGGTPAFSAAEELRLGRGETVVRLLGRPGDPATEGVAARVLPRDAERTWRAVADLDHWHEWVPFLEVSERTPREASGSVAGSGAGRSWRLHFDLPPPLRDRHYRVRADAGSGPAGAHRTVSWISVPGSGNVARARGSFTIEPRGPASTLVVFRSATDTGDATPRFLLDRVLRRSLPWVLDGLAQQVDRCRYALPRPDGCPEDPPGSP